MATKKVEFHEEAAREFLAAVEWYLARNERVASRFVQQVTHAVQLIAQAPQRWPSYSHGTRKIVLRRFPFWWRTANWQPSSKFSPLLTPIAAQAIGSLGANLYPLTRWRSHPTVFGSLI